MGAPGLVTVSVGGLPALKRTIGILDVTLSSDWEVVWRGSVTPTPCPGLAAKVVDTPKTLAVATQEAFDRGGASALAPARVWTGYGNEPKYAAHKRRRGGGESVLVWAGSKTPLRDTFKIGNPDNIFEASGVRMRYGTRRYYAARLQAGGFFQPWDKTTDTPARVMLEVTEIYGREVARGMQRVLRGRLGREGFTRARRNL